MLNRIIAASAIGVALLANTSMITYADVSDAEENSVNVEVETSGESTVEVTTETDEEVGKAVRQSLEVKVADAVCFDSGTNLYDYDGTPLWSKPGWLLWIIGCDDANQRFRVWAPKVKGATTESRVMYLKYEDAKKGNALEEQESLVIGDLYRDGRTDVFDLVWMKRGLIYGWDDSDNVTYALADMNADGTVNIADCIYLQRWLLGAIK